MYLFYLRKPLPLTNDKRIDIERVLYLETEPNPNHLSPLDIADA